MLPTQEAQALRIEEGLSSSILNLHYDEKAKFYRVTVRIAKGDERAEVAYYYVNTDNECFAQEAALSVATTNFLGKSFGYILANVQQGFTNSGEVKTGGNSGEENSKESSKESSSKEASKGKKSVSKKKDSSEKSNLVKEETTTEASEEMEEVESPFTAHPEEKAAKAEKAPKKVYAAYNRTNQRHVDVLTSYLTKLVGNETWKQNPNITQFSISLVGKEFVHDESGELNPDFISTCKNFFFPANGL